MAATTPRKFPSRFGKYILLDRINAGGMAEVYRAKVTGVEEFQRLIAIKCMLPALHKDEQFVTMFKDEAKLSAHLSHANIVQVYELGAIEEQLYIAMELINGRDLRHVIKLAKHKGIPIPAGFAAYAISKAAEGLDFAHHKTGIQGEPLNLVHRDISPQNILMSYEGEVKVVDFGIAKAEERATETRAGVLKGKFAYMAPEQVSGQPVDARTDLFALGCVLYEVLTGKKLFSGESDLSILDKVRNAVVPDFRMAIPNMPDELYETLSKALQRDPDARFSRGNDMAEALEPVLIEGRKIFGAKRAKEFMHELYADEINDLSQRNRRYGAITLDDLGDDGLAEEASKTQIFESAFAGGTIPLRGVVEQVRNEQPEQKPRMPGGDGSLAPPPEAAPRMPQGDGALETSSSRRPRMPTGDGELYVAPEPPAKSEPRATVQVSLEEDEHTGIDSFFSEETGVGTAMPALPPTTLGEDPSPAAPPAVRVEGEAPLTIPRPVVIASIVAAVVMFVLVIVASVVPFGGTTSSGGTQGFVIQEVTETGLVEVKPGVVPVAPEAKVKPGPTESVVEADTPTGAEEGGDDEEDPEGEADKDLGTKGFGYVYLRVNGARHAKIYFEDRELGKAPKRLRLPVGKHVLKVVEQKGGKPGRARSVPVTVGPKDTRKNPARIKVSL